jgi:formylmethanofuran dehydrogenase subunit D
MVQFCTMASIKTVSFGTSTIQKARRIALDPNLLTTLELQEGDTVRIDLDVDSATILIRKDARPEESKAGPGRTRA